MTDNNDKELVQPEVVELPPADPGELREGWDRPAVEHLSLKERLKQSSDTQKVSAEIQGIRRGPGRPRGSRNKPKDEGDTGKAKSQDLSELERQRKLKKQRADAIAGQITGELNDVLFQLLISQGLPPAAVYNEGHIPVSVKTEGKYTPLGSRLAVDNFTAGMVGSFVVEFESSDLGGQLVSKTTGGPVGLVIKGLVAGACVFGYINGVRQVLKEYEPYMKAYKEYQQNQKNSQPQNRQAGGNNNGLQ